MKFTYYGHSCFAVNIEGKDLLFDPFITHNELAKNIDVNGIAADYIFLSHGHEDHVADCISIATRTGAKVVAVWEICSWLGSKGITNTHPMNTGGKKNFDFGTVKCIVAQHSSSQMAIARDEFERAASTSTPTPPLEVVGSEAEKT